MKRTILFAYIISILSLSEAYAQVPANSSRLNMPSQQKSMSLDRPALVPKPSVIEFKPLGLQKPQALNSYYRALLFANPVAAGTTAADNSEVNPLSVERTERRTYGFEEKTRGADEQLYSSDRITVSNVYPNPASDFAELDYTVQNSVRDAKVIIYNVLGSPVAEYALDKNDRKLRINTREMPTSVYFYQLAVDGKKVATKKMLVRHQQ
ncbi:T9SS type A sorting domain-containing protein [Salmonirosea aquatica]|uniref:T9SS type A sorting domain-containing protein n=1 Tax=Salmonirosea aquatica TaxID=2654236 RepID=A0A7C9FB43_9BACT|nr:T9SS type A sorting domain-containing protein [Cytophagaceae bacterium SJW1-29]